MFAEKFVFVVKAKGQGIVGAEFLRNFTHHNHPVNSPVPDYLREAEALRPFYRWSPVRPDPEAIANERRFPNERRSVLTAALQRQYQQLPRRKEVQSAIAALGEKTTFCITTGQQPMLYGGPLYVLYKAVGAVKTAREWEKRLPGRKVVPVFWMAGEDHDASEVNHAYLSYDEKVAYSGALWGAVGRNVIAPASAHVPTHARPFYRPGLGWNEAFRAWLDKLLGPYGLVVIDGDDPALKALFFPVVKRELTEGTGAMAALDTTRRLTGLGYAAQARIRNPNLFFLDDSGRFRLERDGDGFLLKGSDRRLSMQELHDKPPVFFSPNVVLRPVYQETILPSLAYLGGPGELAYWLQLKATFAAFDVAFPAVLRRPGATLISASDAEKLKRMRFDIEDVLRPESELRRECAARLWNRQTYAPYLDHVMQSLERLETTAGVLSPSQAMSVAAQKRKIQRFFDRLVHQTDKEALNRHPRAWKPLLRIKNRVQPDGFIQERTLNLAAVGMAPKAFVAFLMEQLDVRKADNFLVLPGKAEAPAE